MQEFTDEYGAYMEMIYILLNGDLLRMEEVFKLEAHNFLFKVQYLIRKRSIEAREHKRLMQQRGK